MEIFIKGRNCIITPLSNRLDKREGLRLLKEIKDHLLFNIGIDMSRVEDCTIDFLEIIKNRNNISLFNISSEILTLFNIMGLDKLANIYILESDFKNDKNRIVSRNFKIV